VKSSAVVIGASAGLGRAVAERLAATGHDLFLVASDERDLKPLTSCLRLEHGVAADYLAADVATLDPNQLHQQALDALDGQLDSLFLLAGMWTKEDIGPVPDPLASRLLTVNLCAPIRIANAFIGELAKRPAANLVGAGSIASIRPRQKSAIYGAAKTGLESYFLAQRHHLARTGCRVQFYRLGYLSTSMTFGQDLPLPRLSPERAATAIVNGLGRDRGVVHLPFWWLGVAAALNALPWPVYRHLNI